jgi:Rod binding domain-containing protein
MMKELLKPMTGNDALTGEDEGSGGDAGSSGALGEFASEALGQALSQRGGFGIANSIVRDLSHSGNQNKTGKVT